MIRFAIGTLPPSGTVYSRSHWAAKKRWRDLFQGELFVAAFDAGWKRPRKEERIHAMKVNITIYRRRLLDVDNLYAGTKPLVDAMRDIGLIRNDNPRWCSLDVKQVQVKENFRVEITLEKLRPSAPLKRKSKLEKPQCLLD